MATIDLTSSLKDGPAFGSPDWYLERLSAELDRRRVLIDIYEDYYEGRAFFWRSSRRNLPGADVRVQPDA